MKLQTLLWAAVLATLLLFAAVPSAFSIPLLQIYLQGGTYDSTTESWTVTGGTFVLWVIGNVGGPGSEGPIEDVRLAVAYDAGSVPGLMLTPGTTGGYGGFMDTSVPATPTYLQTVTDGSSPILGDGSPLPRTDVYGGSTWWTEFLLGDFTSMDSPMADFITSFPFPSFFSAGQINVYAMQVAPGFSGTLHFDVYGDVHSGNKEKSIFAFPSHDGVAIVPSVPEPASLIMLGSALLGAGCIAFLR